MWHNITFAEDHPSMLMLMMNGFIPPSPTLNMTIMQNTLERVYETWNFTYSYGWDFPVLSMAAARMGDLDQAVN